MLMVVRLSLTSSRDLFPMCVVTIDTLGWQGCREFRCDRTRSECSAFRLAQTSALFRQRSLRWTMEIRFHYLLFLLCCNHLLQCVRLGRRGILCDSESCCIATGGRPKASFRPSVNSDNFFALDAIEVGFSACYSRHWNSADIPKTTEGCETNCPSLATEESPLNLCMLISLFILAFKILSPIALIQYISNSFTTSMRCSVSFNLLIYIQNLAIGKEKKLGFGLERKIRTLKWFCLRRSSLSQTYAQLMLAEYLWGVKQKLTESCNDSVGLWFSLLDRLRCHLPVSLYPVQKVDYRYGLRNVDIIWAVKHSSISATFFDAGAAQFFLPELMHPSHGNEATASKRLKYTTDAPSVISSASSSGWRGQRSRSWLGRPNLEITGSATVRILLFLLEFRAPRHTGTNRLMTRWIMANIALWLLFRKHLEPHMH